MSTTSPTALQYLDKAMGGLRELGLLPDADGSAAPVVALLEQITELEPDTPNPGANLHDNWKCQI